MSLALHPRQKRHLVNERLNECVTACNFTDTCTHRGLDYKSVHVNEEVGAPPPQNRKSSDTPETEKNMDILDVLEFCASSFEKYLSKIIESYFFNLILLYNLCQYYLSARNNQF